MSDLEYKYSQNGRQGLRQGEKGRKQGDEPEEKNLQAQRQSPARSADLQQEIVDFHGIQGETSEKKYIDQTCHLMVA